MQITQVMSSRCNRFKQNAWKKEMCSNCYKTKEEHQERPKPVLPDLPLISPSPSILKGWDGELKKKKRKSVSFPVEESQVIGYGGGELSSDDEDDDNWRNDEGDDDADEDEEDSGGDKNDEAIHHRQQNQETEEDKRLVSITKSNTNFNSLIGNVNSTVAAPPAKKTDQSANKESIKVVIEPMSSSFLANSRKLHLSKLLQESDNANHPPPSPSLTITKAATTKTIINCQDEQKGKDNNNDNKREIELVKKVTTVATMGTSVDPAPQKIIEKEEEPELKLIVKDLSGQPMRVNNFDDGKKVVVVGSVKDDSPSLSLQSRKSLNPLRQDADSRRVNITRGTVLTKNHESAKNKLYIQNIMNAKNDIKKNNVDNKVYIDSKIDSGVDSRNCFEPQIGDLKNKELLSFESRELAGEPDGKADSDGAEVPVTPPPRSSFLHRDLDGSKLGKRRRQAPKPPFTELTIESEGDEELNCEIDIGDEGAEMKEGGGQRRSPLMTSSAEWCGEGSDGRLPDDDDQSDKLVMTPVMHQKEVVEPDVGRDVTPSPPTSTSSLQSSIRPELRLSLIDEGEWCRRSKKKDDDDEDLMRQGLVNNLDNGVTTTRRYSYNDDDYPIKRRGYCCNGDSSGVVTVVTRRLSSDCHQVPTTKRPDSVRTRRSVGEAVGDSPDGGTKRDPPPPEPLPRHKTSSSASFMDVEKKKTKMKETIRKLLRFGSREEGNTASNVDGGREPKNQPRPRPLIIHPIDLNKSAVQVLTSVNMSKTPSPETPPSPLTPSGPIGRPTKPPPPPRSESLNLMERLRGKPGTENNIYANLGEARSGIQPVKPMRTGSMREVIKVVSVGGDPDNGNLYEAISSASSAPECDHPNSMSYYGSETESDIYSSRTLFSRERCKMRKGCHHRNCHAISVCPTVSENLDAIAAINQQTLSYLLKQVVETGGRGRRARGGGRRRWSDYKVTMEDKIKKEINGVVFIDGEEVEGEDGGGGNDRGDRLVTMCILPKDCRLVVAPALPPPIATFTWDGDDDNHHQSHPHHHHHRLTNSGEVSVINRVDVESLKDFNQDNSDEDGPALILLQMCQIMKSIQLDQYSFDSFIILTDRHKSTTVGYLHHKSNRPIIKSIEESSWKSILMSAAGASSSSVEGSHRSETGLSGRLNIASSLDEAIDLLNAWLWGPPPPPTTADDDDDDSPSSSNHNLIIFIKWWIQLKTAQIINSLITATNPCSSIDYLQSDFILSLSSLSPSNLIKTVRYNYNNNCYYYSTLLGISQLTTTDNGK